MLAVGLYCNWRYFTPNGIYQSQKEGSALLGILGEEVKNGDSRASVVKSLGPGTVITDDKFLVEIRENIKQQSTALTDGVQETDVFVEILCYGRLCT